MWSRNGKRKRLDEAYGRLFRSYCIGGTFSCFRAIFFLHEQTVTMYACFCWYSWWIDVQLVGYIHLSSHWSKTGLLTFCFFKNWVLVYHVSDPKSFFSGCVFVSLFLCRILLVSYSSFSLDDAVVIVVCGVMNFRFGVGGGYCLQEPRARRWAGRKKRRLRWSAK